MERVEAGLVSDFHEGEGCCFAGFGFGMLEEMNEFWDSGFVLNVAEGGGGFAAGVGVGVVEGLDDVLDCGGGTGFLGDRAEGGDDGGADFGNGRVDRVEDMGLCFTADESECPGGQSFGFLGCVGGGDDVE